MILKTFPKSSKSLDFHILDTHDKSGVGYDLQGKKEYDQNLLIRIKVFTITVASSGYPSFKCKFRRRTSKANRKWPKIIWVPKEHKFIQINKTLRWSSGIRAYSKA